MTWFPFQAPGLATGRVPRAADDGDGSTNTDRPAGNGIPGWVGSFARDTLTWAFARFAEALLNQVLDGPSALALYEEWLCGDARHAPVGASWLMRDIDLGPDGCCHLLARTERDEFVLAVKHPEFEVVLGLAACLAHTPIRLVGVCTAAFSGDATLAARWASGLERVLERRRHREPNGDALTWQSWAAPRAQA